MHGTFSRIDHILGNKSSLSKFKKIEIISSIFSDHNTMRLEINYREKKHKNTNTWRLNNMLLKPHYKNKLLFKTRETKTVKEREILTKFFQGL